MKSKESVFATLCSTLSQAVVPSKNTTNTSQDNKDTAPNKETDDKNTLTVGPEVAINGSWKKTRSKWMIKLK